MDEPFKLTFADQKMTAYLTVDPERLQTEPTVDDILKYLHDTGIVSGIDRDAIKQMVDERAWDEKIQVAFGRRPIKGKDGFVKYFFETEQKCQPKVKENGSVDYHDLTLVENVSVNQQLAILTLPTNGTPGEDIFGKIIPAARGKAMPLLSGKNTKFVDENNTILKSTTEGHAKLKRDGMVHVETVFTVKHNVDFSTGDIQVNGDVCVRGDIKAGFAVKATGCIEVRGVIEDAYVEAGGDILVKKGFIGQGKGIIKAGGKVVISFVQNQKIIAEGNIEIGQSAIQADLNTGDALLINRGRSALIGGIARATKYAEVDLLGNDQDIKTMLIVGTTEQLEKQIVELNQEITKNAENLKKVKSKIAQLMALKPTKRWKPELEQVYRSLEKLMVDLPKYDKELRENKSQLQADMEKIRRQSHIRVKKRIYPGVSLKLCGLPRKFESEWNGAVFKIIDDELIGVPEK